MPEILNTSRSEDNSSIDDYTKWSILAEHGGTMGVREDPMEKMGTRDENLLESADKLRTCTYMANAKEVVAELPDKSLNDVMSRRFKKTAHELRINPNEKEKIGEMMNFDLVIIADAIELGRDIKDMNVATLMGDEDYRDISGLLDAYSEKINDSGMGDIVLRDAHTESVIENKDTHQPYKASEIINALKNELNKEKNEEAGE